MFKAKSDLTGVGGAGANQVKQDVENVKGNTTGNGVIKLQ